MTNHFNHKIRQSYDNIAETWNKEREWYIEQPSIDEAIIRLKPGSTILDVGCGSGKPIAAYLVEKGFDVHGLDISPKLIQYAKQIIPEKKLFLADICEFTTDIHFDAIICWSALFHIHANSHLDVLKKLHSFLKPKGLLLITFADTRYKPDWIEFKIIDEFTIESEMFGERFCHSGHPANINSELIKQAGFEIISDKIDQPGSQVILARKK
jgi:2-polyprenyl-3-methyl-5-hydroxy-6-metoxy-1,4-benzoquinol methylase